MHTKQQVPFLRHPPLRVVKWSSCMSVKVTTQQAKYAWSYNSTPYMHRKQHAATLPQTFFFTAQNSDASNSLSTHQHDGHVASVGQMIKEYNEGGMTLMPNCVKICQYSCRVTRRMFALQIGSLCPHLAMLSGQMLICLTLPVQLNNVRLRHIQNNSSRWLVLARESVPRLAVSCTSVITAALGTLLVACRAAAAATECSEPLIQQPSQFYPPPILTTYFPKIHLTN